MSLTNDPPLDRATAPPVAPTPRTPSSSSRCATPGDGAPSSRVVAMDLVGAMSAAVPGPTLHRAAHAAEIVRGGVLALQGEVAATTKRGSGPVDAYTAAIDHVVRNGSYAQVLKRWGPSDEAVTRSEIDPPGLPRTGNRPPRGDTPMPVTAPLHLAAEIGGPPRYDPEHHIALARLAERGALDFVTLGDSFARPGPDALAVLSRVAPATDRIGLVPTVTTTHTEPFHVSSAVATLDWVSRGRAGWLVDVSTTAAEARLFGRRPAAHAEELWREAGDTAEVSARLWDSWEDDAEIRDVATGRFVDRDKLHHIDFEGEFFSVRGPAIVPRPPQGRPVTVVDTASGPAAHTAARHADVVLVRASAPERAAALRDELRRRAAAYGRDPDTLRFLIALTVDLGDAETTPEPGLDSGPALAAGGSYFRGGPVDLAELIIQWHRGGAADGFHLTPITPGRDLERIVNGTAALLQHRGLFRTFHPGGTLREHLGLARPANRYALEGGRA